MMGLEKGELVYHMAMFGIHGPKDAIVQKRGLGTGIPDFP